MIYITVVSCSLVDTKTLFHATFGVASNSVADRACPVPYNLMDTTFAKSQWLSDIRPMKIQGVGSWHVFMFVNISVKETWRTQLPNKSRIEKDWKTEVETFWSSLDNSFSSAQYAPDVLLLWIQALTQNLLLTTWCSPAQIIIIHNGTVISSASGRCYGFVIRVNTSCIVWPCKDYETKSFYIKL